jgi:hypothetical protein
MRADGPRDVDRDARPRVCVLRVDTAPVFRSLDRTLPWVRCYRESTNFRFSEEFLYDGIIARIERSILSSIVSQEYQQPGNPTILKTLCISSRHARGCLPLSERETQVLPGAVAFCDHEH